MKAIIRWLLFAVGCWWLSGEYGRSLIEYGFFGIIINGALISIPIISFPFALWVDFGKRGEDKENWTHE